MGHFIGSIKVSGESFGLVVVCRNNFQLSGTCWGVKVYIFWLKSRLVGLGMYIFGSVRLGV